MQGKKRISIISRLSTMVNNLQVVLLDKERKPIPQVAAEFLKASLKSRSLATYYFTDYLYKKSITNYQDYVPHKEWQYMQRAICDPMTHVILGDKLFFHEFFTKFGFPMPKLLAFSIRERLFVNDRDRWGSYEVTTPETLAEIVGALLGRSAHGVIFVKPTGSSGGHGILRFKDDPDIDRVAQTAPFFKDFLSGVYIYQEQVVQHSQLAPINPSSLNTVRIDTFKAFGREPEVLSAYLRIGRQKGCVDNLTGGGIRVGIHKDLGTLKKTGTTNMLYGPHWISHHPDSGIAFEGFPVPFFSEVKSLAIRAASCLPQSLVGWDIGISESGPVLIEGNTVYYAMSGADIAYGGYRNNPVYNKVTNYVKNTLNNPRK